MSCAGVASPITGTIRIMLGIAVGPHMFRTAIASSAAIYGGSNPLPWSALLHHRDPRVMEARYNRASSLTADKALGLLIQRYRTAGR